MKISTIAIGILAAGLIRGVAGAAETTYGAGAQALPLRQEGGTARAMGMGSAVVAVEQGSASLLWNPAGLGRMDCKEVGIHHNSGLGDTVQEIIVVGSPLGEVKGDCKGGSLGGIAASLGYVNYGNFEGTTLNGAPGGSYSAGDLSLSLGYGKEILPSLSAGVVMKGNRSSFGDSSYMNYAADVGLLWAVHPKLDLGVTYTNLALGPGLSGASVAAGVRLGAGWKANNHWLLAASGELQDGGAVNRFQLGTEYLIGDVKEIANVLALRGGYALDFPDAQLGMLNGLSLGIGYTLTKSISVDYAFLPAGDLGASHRLSATFKFGCPTLAAAVKPAPVKPAPVKIAPVVVKATATVVAAPAYSMVTLEDAHFDFNSAKLKPEGMKALDANIAVMKANPKLKVRVAGYTSKSGTAEYNQKLSERRADAVRTYLLSQGIDKKRISTIGYGETRPNTHEKRAEGIDSKAAHSNMRVLFEMYVD